MKLYNDIVRWVQVKLGKRCKGDCCKRFYLPVSPEELKQSYLKATNRLDKTLEGYDNISVYTDIETIAPMAVLVATEQSSSGCYTKHFYRCKNLTKDGDCGIYSTRPWMCSEYPYGGQCGFEGCTWSAASGKTVLYKLGLSCKKAGKSPLEAGAKNFQGVVKQREV